MAENWPLRAQSAVKTLVQKWFESARGLYSTTRWWQAAVGTHALADYMNRSGDLSYVHQLELTFTRAPGAAKYPGFINSFYDDTAWWALAWVAAFDLRRDPRYLNTAWRAFQANQAGWDKTHGGMWWNTGHPYKAAIATEQMMLLGARLARRPSVAGFDKTGAAQWAIRVYEWFFSSGLVSDRGLVADQLDQTTNLPHGPAYTYNQGVILSALAALYRLGADPTYLQRGELIADAAISQLTSYGVLCEITERGGGKLTPDGVMFKGIFCRGLYDFWQVDPRPAYKTFLLNNSRSVWAHARGGGNMFDAHWPGPFRSADAGRQISAINVLNTCVALSS